MFLLFARFILAPICRAIWVREVRGLENLPKDGPFLVAANHQSFADPPILWAILATRYSGKKIRFVAKGEWFRQKGVLPYLRNKFFSTFLAMPTNGSTEYIIEAIRQKNIIVMFPEGYIAPPGVRWRARTGISAVAIITGAPVIPVSLQGMREIWPRAPRSRPYLRKNAVVTIGKPFYINGDLLKENLQNKADEIMRIICSEIGENYDDIVAE